MSEILAVDPQKIPAKKLRNGTSIPVVGLGTFGSDHITPQEVAEAVKQAIKLGYRHIDCAAVYMNEKEIGGAIKEAIEAGYCTREELFITSKVWNDCHDKVIQSCEKSLSDLGLDYLDLYLVHWPFPNYHAPGCDVDSRNPDSVPFKADLFLKTWNDMQTLYNDGKVKAIGTSNMTIAKFEATLNRMEILPAVNEMEMHPCFQQEDLFLYCLENKIQPIGYSPIGSPARPERDRTPDDAVDIEHPVVQKIAKRIGVHPAVVCIKWAVQRGEVVIPFSTKPRNFMSNLSSVTGDPLTEEEMEEMKTVECGSRLIKGQVFLWEGAKGWEDLWDLDGKIAQ